METKATVAETLNTLALGQGVKINGGDFVVTCVCRLGGEVRSLITGVIYAVVVAFDLSKATLVAMGGDDPGRKIVASSAS